MNKVMIFPTDTVYGIGAKLYDKDGINEIYKIKGRSFTKPLPVLCSNIKQIEGFAILNKEALLLARRFWPGGLTIILKTNDNYFNLTNERTIAVRIPNHKTALDLIDKYGPLKTTSVNDSGEEPLNDYNVIKNRYEDLVSLILPNNEKIEEVSSTIVDLVDSINILRLGNITKKDIMDCLEVL